MKLFEITFTAMVEGEWYDHVSTIMAKTAEEAIALLESEMGVDKDNVQGIQELMEIPEGVTANSTPSTVH